MCLAGHRPAPGVAGPGLGSSALPLRGLAEQTNPWQGTRPITRPGTSANIREHSWHFFLVCGAPRSFSGETTALGFRVAPPVPSLDSLELSTHPGSCSSPSGAGTPSSPGPTDLCLQLPKGWSRSSREWSLCGTHRPWSTRRVMPGQTPAAMLVDRAEGWGRALTMMSPFRSWAGSMAM